MCSLKLPYLLHLLFLFVNKLHQVLQMFPSFFTMYTLFGVILPKHPQDLLGELSFGFSGGAAVLGSSIF